MRLRTLDANWNRIRMHRGSCRHEYRNFPNTIGINEGAGRVKWNSNEK